MEGSEVESSIGHRRRRFPYAFSGIGGAEFSKKCDLLMNTNGQQSDAKVAPRPGAPDI